MRGVDIMFYKRHLIYQTRCERRPRVDPDAVRVQPRSDEHASKILKKNIIKQLDN